jgi:WD40 repeat protein
MKRLLRQTILLGVAATIVGLHTVIKYSQPSGCATSFNTDIPYTLPAILKPITAASASDVIPLARIGRGKYADFAWSPDCQTFAVASTIGVWLYRRDDAPRLLEAPNGQVQDVEWSPDGRQIAGMGSYPHLTYSQGIWLWNVENGELSGTWKSDQAIFKIGFKPDGTLLAFTMEGEDCASCIATLRLIRENRTLTAEKLNILGPNMSDIRTLGLDDSASTLAVAGGFIGGSRVDTSKIDYNIRVWNVNTDADLPAPLAVLPANGMSGPITLNASGTRVAFAVGGIYLYNVQTRALLKQWTDATGPLAFSADGNLFAFLSIYDDANSQTVYGKNYHIRLFDMTSGKDAEMAIKLAGYVLVMSFTPDGNALGVLSADDYGDQQIRFFSVVTGEEVGSLPINRLIETITLTPDEQNIINWGYDAVDVWDIQTGALQVTDHRVGSPKSAVSPSRSRPLLALNTANGATEVSTLNIWNMQTGQIAFSQSSADRINTGMAFSHDGRLFALASIQQDPNNANQDSRIEIRDTDTWTIRQQWAGGENSLNFSPDDGFLVALGYYGLQVWDVQTGEMSQLSSDWYVDGSTVRFLSGGAVMLFAKGGRLMIRDLNRGRDLERFTGRWAEAINRDERFAAMRTKLDLDHANVGIWNLKTGHLFAHLESPGTDYPDVLYFSPDSRYLVARETVYGESWVWNWISGERILHLTDHSFMTFSPDGSLMADATSDGRIHLWDTATWTEAAVLTGHGERSDLQFNRDGTLLISTGGGSLGDGILRLWGIPS